MNESGRVRRVGKRYSRKRDAVLEDPDLGILIDKVIAKRHGCSHATVYQARKLAGISSTLNHDYKDYEKMILAQPDLGKVKDRVIAERLGIADTTVCKYRNKHDISPAYPEFSPRGWTDAVVDRNNELLRSWL